MSRASSSVPNLSTNVRYSPVSGLVVICGATATGKSGLAIALAQRLLLNRINSAIISADSRQVYREFNIGTAKPSIQDQKEVPHCLIDICNPRETLTVADYQMYAQALIARCHDPVSASPLVQSSMNQPDVHSLSAQPIDCLAHSSSPIPLLVGGTGLYIRAVTKGLKIPRVPPQPALRSQLQTLGQAQCYEMLCQVDPKAAQKIHPNDEVRTVRSLEVFYTTGSPISEQQGENPPDYPILQIGLDCANPSNLQQRIVQRTKQMVVDGLVDEVDYLCQKYQPDLPLLNTLGYAEFKQYWQGTISQAEALEQTILHTRQFAKRQRTWFRAYPEIEWFDADAPNLVEQVWQRVETFFANKG